jgi:hypothetical protein
MLAVQIYICVKDEYCCVDGVEELYRLWKLWNLYNNFILKRIRQST